MPTAVGSSAATAIEVSVRRTTSFVFEPLYGSTNGRTGVRPMTSAFASAAAWPPGVIDLGHGK